MNATRRKMLWRGIRGSLNRFLSILGIVALGSGFLAGLVATTPDMELTADAYMRDSAFYDLDVKSTQGLTAADADALLGQECIARVMPAYVTDALLATGESGEGRTVRIFGYPDLAEQSGLNRLTLLDGRLPESPEECVVQMPNGYMTAVPMGATLRFSEDNENYDSLDDTYSITEFTVVGLAMSPMFMSVEPEASSIGSGSVEFGIFVPAESYSMSVYTDVYATFADTDGLNSFSNAYLDLSNAHIDSLDALASEREQVRYDEIVADANEQVESGRNLVKSICDIANAKIGSLRANDGMDELTREVIDSLTAAGASDADLLDELHALTDALPASVNKQRMGLLTDSRLSDAEKELADAEEALSELEPGTWYLRARKDNVGFSSYKGNIEKVAALAKIFPVFFFLVALLVSLTTMTRLVEEERTQIGTLKALGYSDGAVLEYYLLYSLISSLAGCVIGLAVGFQAFPKVISGAYAMMYTLPATITPFSWSIALLVGPVTIGAIMLATYAVCQNITLSMPATLMLPKAPKSGKRILLERASWLWTRLSFMRKVTARNLFRYKKRLYMTIIGMAGCSALLLTGFGLRDSITDIVEKQFGEINKYGMTVILADENAVNDDAVLSGFLKDDKAVESYLPVSMQSGKVLGKSSSVSITICVPESANALPDFIALRNRVSHEPVAFGESGVVLTERLCEDLGIVAGDSVEIESADGKSARFTVAGITENYISAYAYMSEREYSSAFGEKPAYTTLLVRLQPGNDEKALAARVLESGEVAYARVSSALRETFSDSVKSIDSIVMVLIVAAGLLSVIVLYNLTNVNICERRRELATLKVLGFYDAEVQNYIFRETYILGFIGSLAGLGVGVWLHSFVIRTVEIGGVMFGRTIAPMSYLYAALLSVGFTAIVTFIMKRHINKIDIVESMKAVD